MPENQNSQKWSDLYRSKLNQQLSQTVTVGELSKVNDSLDSEAEEIYRQSRKQRSILLRFYISYTACTTIVILWLVLAQAIVRIMTPDTRFEIMPQWTMDFVVAGMFGQFVGLLQIVTKSVWNLKSFFDHHYEMHKDKKQENGANEA